MKTFNKKVNAIFRSFVFDHLCALEYWMWIRNASRCFGGVGDTVTDVLKAKLKGIAHSKQGRY